jgi:hypothetical protein
MKKFLFAAAIAGALPAADVCAGGFDEVRQLSRDAFQQLAKDVAAVTALRALTPGVSLDLLGFDLGVELGVTNVDDPDVWRRAGGGRSAVVTPRVTIHKGLAGGLDIGASLGASGTSGLATAGAMLRYQVVAPTTLLPGLAARVSHNRDVGDSAIGVRSLGADAIFAKPLPMITPYVGVGALRTEARAKSSSLGEVATRRTRVFFGFDAQLAFASFAAEAEKSGGATTVSSKIGFRF